MAGYTINTRGRYKCNFCDHKTYKHHSGVMTHLQERHPELLKMAEKNEELQNTLNQNKRIIQRLENQPPKVVEKVVYRDPPAEKKKEYWYVRNYGLEGIYCTACKQVQTGVGIPVGQTIENTPHSCGNRTLLPVVEVR